MSEAGEGRAALPAVPLKGSPAWQLQDTVLKMSNQAICSERKITTAITALDFLVEHRQNDENRLATQSLNVGVPGQGKLQQLACCANDMPV